MPRSSHACASLCTSRSCRLCSCAALKGHASRTRAFPCMLLSSHACAWRKPAAQVCRCAELKGALALAALLHSCLSLHFLLVPHRSTCMTGSLRLRAGVPWRRPHWTAAACWPTCLAPSWSTRSNWGQPTSQMFAPTASHAACCQQCIASCRSVRDVVAWRLGVHRRGSSFPWGLCVAPACAGQAAGCHRPRLIPCR